MIFEMMLGSFLSCFGGGYGGGYELTSLEVMVDSGPHIVGEEVKFWINIRGRSDRLWDKLGVIYPKGLGGVGLEVVDVEFSHRLMGEEGGGCGFEVGIVYYLRAREKGEYKIPNLDIGFEGDETKITTGERGVEVFEDYFDYYKEYIYSLVIILMGLLVIMRFQMGSVKGYKELRIYRELLRKEGVDVGCWDLLLEYLMERYGLKGEEEKLMLEGGDLSVLGGMGMVLKERLWHFHEDLSLSNEGYVGVLEEDLKDILYLMRREK